MTWRQCGLEIVPVEGDGNCLFRSLSHQLYGTERQHLEIRKQIVQFLLENKQEYEPFIGNVSQYCKKMSKSGVYGTNVELAVASRVYGISIFVHQEETLYRLGEGKRIDVVYDAALEHYDSTRVADPSQTLEPVSSDRKSNRDDKKREQMAQIVLKSLDFLTERDIPRIFELLDKHRLNPSSVVDVLLESQDPHSDPTAQPIQPIEEPTEATTQPTAEKTDNGRPLSKKEKRKLKKQPKQPQKPVVQKSVERLADDITAIAI
ncbi:hypothetical protein EDD86DRAFT_92560 [Gorgonomyces haynaldii]|nr:hypothetical protein EDD86DRAFT_92560 [Gorgonomyces haynaldii]